MLTRPADRHFAPVCPDPSMSFPPLGFFSGPSSISQITLLGRSDFSNFPTMLWIFPAGPGIFSLEVWMMRKELFEPVPGQRYKVRCRICGKEMLDVGKSAWGVRSHARMHVRKGEAIEIREPSARCCDGYDSYFYMEVDE